MFLQWFDLFARIIKIVILSAIYTTVIFAILVIVLKKTKYKWLKNRMSHYKRNWLLVHFLISLGLFIFSFSYWQDTGLGEAPSLPIGYEQNIYCSDYETTYFFPDLKKTDLNKDELVIDSFVIKNDILCAKISHQFSNSPKFDFIVCDLSKRTSQTFLSEKGYTEYATNNGLPLTSQFYDFKKQYKEYFAKKPKWEKWLLP